MANCVNRITEAGEFNKVLKVDFTQTAPDCTQYVIFWANEATQLLELIGDNQEMLEEAIQINDHLMVIGLAISCFLGFLVGHQR